MTTDLKLDDGYYAVQYNGIVGFYVLRTSKPGTKYAGKQWLNRYHSDYRNRVGRIEDASVRAAIAADPLTAMRAFADKFTRCGRCGRALTDGLSRAWGIGPDCRDIMGLGGESPRRIDQDAPIAERVEAPLAVQVHAEPGHYDGSITVKNQIATLVSPYDPQLVGRVRSIHGRVWNSAEKVWTFPATPQSLAIAATLCETFNLEAIGFEVPSGVDVAASEAPEIGGKVFIENGRGALVSGYDKKLVERVRQIPGRRWEDCGNCFHRQADHQGGTGRCEYCGECPEYTAKKQWTFPVIPATADEVAQIARDFRLEMAGDMAVLAERAATNKEHSRAADAEFDVEGLGGELLPFQRAGVRYATTNKRVLIADEMGLGKTVQALATIQHLHAYPALVIVPKLAWLGWERETRKWLPGRTVAMLKGTMPPEPRRQTSLTSFAITKNLADQALTADVVIVNYDIVGSYTKDGRGPSATEEWGGWADLLRRREWGAVIVDESQYMKNPKAKRTKAVKALCQLAEVRLLLSGTPIMNRPAELKTQLEALGQFEALGGWQTWKAYQGGDTQGLIKLNEHLRATCFVRRTKADVMPELPAKRYVSVPVPLANEARYREHERSFVAYIRDKLIAKGFDPDEAMTAAKMHAAGLTGNAEALVMIEALKQTAAQEKLAATFQWIDEFLTTGKKLLMFATHREIVNAIADHFGCPRIMGGMSVENRKAIEDRFQTDDSCNLLVLNIEAGGIAITLTEASDVAFMEFPWRPTDIDQAADRAYGRVNNPHGVTVWYLAAARTIDEFVCNLLDEKRPVVAATLDGQVAEEGQSIVGDLMAAMFNTKAVA